MEIEKCPKFNTCSAPLCPLDLNVEKYCWFPDEAICNRKYIPRWAKNQRKIKKKAKDKNSYFVYAMLNRNCRVKKGITGLNPNKAEAPQLKRWLKEHPAKRVLTEKEKQVFRERITKNIKLAIA